VSGGLDGANLSGGQLTAAAAHKAPCYDGCGFMGPVGVEVGVGRFANSICLRLRHPLSVTAAVQTYNRQEVQRCTLQRV
jgi:hypothetical protein